MLAENAVPTVTTTALEVVAAPLLSVAFAVSENAPAPGFIHAKVYGGLRLSPSFVVPLKNSTLLTLPSASEAFATRVMVAGAWNRDATTGLVMPTHGAAFAGGSSTAALAPTTAAIHVCANSPGAFQFKSSQ